MPGIRSDGGVNLTREALAETLAGIPSGDYSRIEQLLALNPASDATWLAADHLFPGRKWAFLGDSITNATGASNAVYGFPSLSIQAAGSMHARPDSIQAGTSGYNSAQALAWLPTVLATAPTPDALVLMIGVIDAGNSIPFATYQANVTAIVKKCKQAGIPVVLCTIVGTAGGNATTQIRTFIKQANAWLRLWGPTQGCEIAETYGATVDTTTGDLAAAYDSGDGLHPNNLGHAKMAQPVTAAMIRALADRATGTVFAKDTFSINPNPLMVGGGAMPTGYFENPGGTGTAPAYSIVADTTTGLILPAGRWALMDFTGTVGGTRNLAIALNATGWSVGDILAFMGIVLIEDISGTYEADVVSGVSTVNPQLVKDTAVSIQSFGDRTPGRNRGNLLGTGNTVWQLGPFFTPVTIPAATAGLILYNYVQVPTGKHYKAYFGGLDFLNMTTLGLTAFGGVTKAMTVINGP